MWNPICSNVKTCVFKYENLPSQMWSNTFICDIVSASRMQFYVFHMWNSIFYKLHVVISFLGLYFSHVKFYISTFEITYFHIWNCIFSNVKFCIVTCESIFFTCKNLPSQMGISNFAHVKLDLLHMWNYTFSCVELYLFIYEIRLFACEIQRFHMWNKSFQHMKSCFFTHDIMYFQM